MTHERDIVHENGDYWVHRDKASYVVYRNGITHAVSDSGYAKDEAGLSLAKARADYLAKRVLMSADAEGLRRILRFKDDPSES